MEKWILMKAQRLGMGTFEILVGEKLPTRKLIRFNLRMIGHVKLGWLDIAVYRFHHPWFWGPSYAITVNNIVVALANELDDAVYAATEYISTKYSLDKCTVKWAILDAVP